MNKLYLRIKEIADTEVAEYNRKRVENGLEPNGVVEKNTLIELIKFYFPDIRSIIQQMHVNFGENSGSISGIPTFTSKDVIIKMWGYVEANDDIGLRKYVSEYVTDFGGIYSLLGEYVSDKLEGDNNRSKRVTFGVMLGDYQYRHANPSTDPEINLNSLMLRCIQLIHG